MTGPSDEHEPGEIDPVDQASDGLGAEAGDDYGDDYGDEFGDEDFADEPEGESTRGSNALPPKMEAWRRRSAAGAILTGFALGLQQALEPKRDEPSIVVQTSGDPPTDLPVEADFEYRRPKNTVVNVRPWLLEGAPSESTGQPAGDEEEEK